MKQKYLINWIGGKRLLRPVIADLIPDKIGSYIEVFGGGAWVLCYKDKWANLEVYNDLDEELANLFTIVKYHPEALEKELRFMLTSRTLFAKTLESTTFTDIQKAAKFFFLITRSFGGKGETLGTCRNGEASGGKSHANSLKRIYEISERFDKVTIENLDFKTLIPKYDIKSAFFYCDPPYSRGAGYRVTSTKDFDHTGLRNVLENAKGKWLLSYDNSTVIKDLYKGYKIIEVIRKNTLNNLSNSSDYQELLIKNY